VGPIFLAGSGPAQTTASFATLATGTAIITLLQIKPLSGVSLRIKEWGVSFDGSAAATPGKIELIETDVAATVTALASGDITKLTHPDGDVADTALISLGTAATGYNASAEGTITAVRNLDGPQLIAPTNQFIKQFPLGLEPVVRAGKFLRIRAKFGTGVNAYAYVIFQG
jgi:hypothetical protein